MLGGNSSVFASICTDVKPESMTRPANDKANATSGSLVWLSAVKSGTEKSVVLTPKIISTLRRPITSDSSPNNGCSGTSAMLCYR
ncbi:hypothetical protein PAN31108_01074 [Pandoraea anhela]|uniref:Uncharacterized protein n=1 Tax=Pandoraea anhela TaxID=2508295 RepID=A0A5E4SXJ9_9BURK|nr:hypothetical protein PAN31108_01074 [Pandoraea anhela]